MLVTTRHEARTPAGRLPLLIAHGLYGSGRNWGALARQWSDERDVIAVDMRNHGRSPHFPTHGYEEMAADLAEVITGIGGRADVLGHSMGGKAVMQLALTRGDLVRRLVVIDIAPVPYSEHDQMRYVRAMEGLDLSGLTTLKEADERLARTLSSAMLRGFFLQSLDIRAAGGPHWRLNLDVLGAEMARITGWPGTPGTFAGSALFLHGEESDYLRPEHHATIRRQFPEARITGVPGAGHWVHAEKPQAVEEAVRAFLDADAP